jgi:hypothetical protein
MDLHLAVFLVTIGCCCFVLKNKGESILHSPLASCSMHWEWMEHNTSDQSQICSFLFQVWFLNWSYSRERIRSRNSSRLSDCLVMCCHTVYLHTPSLSFEAMMVAIWATQVGISETPHSLRSWTRGQYLTAPGLGLMMRLPQLGHCALCVPFTFVQFSRFLPLLVLAWELDDSKRKKKCWEWDMNPRLRIRTLDLIWHSSQLLILRQN